jgi:tetratricopeptide (TPR) repeat protein
MLQGKHQEARAELWKFYQAARNDGDRRNALFNTSVTYVDEGNFDKAVGELKKEYAVAQKINDPAAMAADEVAMGDVLLEAGKPEEAKKIYAHSLGLIEQSNLSAEVKENARLVDHYNLARVAIAAGDLAGARQHTETFMKAATARNNRAEIRQGHELAGAIALQDKKFELAITELTQANQQDAYNLYRLGLAYQGKGQSAVRAGRQSEHAAGPQLRIRSEQSEAYEGVVAIDQSRVLAGGAWGHRFQALIVCVDSTEGTSCQTPIQPVVSGACGSECSSS